MCIPALRPEQKRMLRVKRKLVRLVAKGEMIALPGPLHGSWVAHGVFPCCYIPTLSNVSGMRQLLRR